MVIDEELFAARSIFQLWSIWLRLSIIVKVQPDLPW